MYTIRRLDPNSIPAIEERMWQFATLAEVMEFLTDKQSQPSINPAFCGRRLEITDPDGQVWGKGDFLWKNTTF